jgi:hypothetical protein
VADDGPPLQTRSGALVARREVHFEAWAIQALAETLDSELRVAATPHTENELRGSLEYHPDEELRARGLAALGALEAARDVVAAARPDGLVAALAGLDTVFIELTERDATRNPGMAYGARTLCYLDCVRDLDVTLGPGFVEDVAPVLEVLFEAGRWYSGRVARVASPVIESALPDEGRGPFGPVMGRVLRTLFELGPELAAELGREVEELHGRLGALLADPDPATIGRRAVAAFADFEPGWRHSVFSSVDLQVASSDEAAVAAGDYLAVVGDVHLGGNPLIQGVFAHRHPNRDDFLADFVAAVGEGWPILIPPWTPTAGVEGRGLPATTEDMVHIAVLPETRAPANRRTWLPGELLVDGTEVVDRTGQLRVSVRDVFALPVFITGMRMLSLLPEADHAPRVTIGKTVLRREGWNVPATDVPQRAEEVAAFARERGMPRRVFTKSPLERKPMYLDTDSPTLCRIFCRQARQLAAGPNQERLSITEMFPTPEQCWLADAADNRYVAEFRLVAQQRNSV